MSKETTTPEMIPCPIVGEICDHPESIDCDNCKRWQRRGNQTEEPTIITILDNGEYHDKVGHDKYIVGRSFSGITDIRKEGHYLKNWNVVTVAIHDMSRAVIEDSTLENLDVRGFCILKNCKIDRVRVSMFGNLFITEGCDINELDISGTVHTISSASKVDHINLHHGGRIKLRTKDFQLGRPPQPKNLRLDADREWYYGILAITKHQDCDEAEYWAFG
ncbi:MAG: hypothetical protein J5614_00540 [Paludibacteraceae bacterium]|nr:hypothetical protein [Paludibacteraceae bacterium]